MQKPDKKFSSEEYIAIYRVDVGSIGSRLDQYMQKFLKTFSRQQIIHKIKKKEIYISNVDYISKPSSLLREGHEVTMISRKHEGAFKWETFEANATKEDPKILIETSDLVFSYKPPFWATHPTGKYIFDCLTTYLEDKLKSRIHNVHRLDRETSGILVMGKNIPTARLLTASFEDRKIKKFYFLITHKRKKITFPLTANQKIEKVIDSTNPKCRSGDNLDHGMEAKTDFFKVAENKNFYLLVAAPYTGRQHQIRVHAEVNEFPLIGDKVYGVDSSLFSNFKEGILSENEIEKLILKRHALHAVALKIPTELYSQIVYSPLPADLFDWVKKQKWDILSSEIYPKIKNIIQMSLSDS